MKKINNNSNLKDSRVYLALEKCRDGLEKIMKFIYEEKESEKFHHLTQYQKKVLCGLIFMSVECLNLAMDAFSDLPHDKKLQSEIGQFLKHNNIKT